MLVPNPATLRAAVERYRALTDPETTQCAPTQLCRDAAYTLCVLTGTRTVAAALIRAADLSTRAADAGSAQAVVDQDRAPTRLGGPAPRDGSLMAGLHPSAGLPAAALRIDGGTRGAVPAALDAGVES